MKTFDGKNVTKKQIQETLRTMDANKIFYLYHKITGKPCEQHKVMRFIEEYAPTEEIRKSSFTIAYLSSEKWKCSTVSIKLRNRWDYEHSNPRQMVMIYFREQIKNISSRYAKRPILGHTHLYFASPIYGHSDYNKWCAMEIAGNEIFCNTLIALADKYWGKMQ